MSSLEGTGAGEGGEPPSSLSSNFPVFYFHGCFLLFFSFPLSNRLLFRLFEVELS